jgi:hypothetical protein
MDRIISDGPGLGKGQPGFGRSHVKGLDAESAHSALELGSPAMDVVGDDPALAVGQGP